MLSKLGRIISDVRFKSWSKICRPIEMSSTTRRFTNSMYCSRTGCSSHKQTCGKWPEPVAATNGTGLNKQDLLLYVDKGLSQYISNIDENALDASVKEKARAHIVESMFSTLTNKKQQFDQINQEIEDNPGNFFVRYKEIEDLNEDALRLASLHATKQIIDDANCFGLRECAVYGLKGTMAYFQHAESMHKSVAEGIYSEQERESIYEMCVATMNELRSSSRDLAFWLKIIGKIGEINVKVMELIDKSHETLFGMPQPTTVAATPIHGKCILMSGYNIFEVQKVLNLIDKKKLNINVYTHGELLPAHSYPELKKFSNFVGHIGSAWQNQYNDFAAFPGPIIMTSNCLMQPCATYENRLYTIDCIGYDQRYADVQHLDTNNENELEIVLQKAMECDGFDETTIGAWKNTKDYTCGSGNTTVLSADTVTKAINGGDFKHTFVIGYCDGSEKIRSYYEDLAGLSPDNYLCSVFCFILDCPIELKEMKGLCTTIHV